MEAQNKILVVDDDESIRDFLQEVLSDEGYDVELAENGRIGFEKALRGDFDLIILDVMMPVMNGFETCIALKKDPKTAEIPVIFLTSMDTPEHKIKGLEAGANDFLIKPVDLLELKLRVRNMLKINEYNKFLKQYNLILAEQVSLKTQELRIAYEKLDQAHKQIKYGYLDTIYRLTLAAEFRDPETAGHLRRISTLTAFLARSYGLRDDFVENIYFASPMHDIGKIAISDNILLKPAKLNRDEFSIMREHTLIGKQLLEGSHSRILKTGELIAAAHHERYDGTGYPRGLRNDEIPEVARLVMLADVYDALRSPRPYKPPISHEKSIEIIRFGDERTKPEHFDPFLLELFLDNHRKINEIYESGEFHDPVLDLLQENSHGNS